MADTQELIQWLRAEAESADDNAASGCNISYVEPMKEWDATAKFLREAADALTSIAGENQELREGLSEAQREAHRWKCHHDDVVRKKRDGGQIKDSRTDAAEARAEAAEARIAEIERDLATAVALLAEAEPFLCAA